MGDVPPAVPDPVKRALSEDLANALKRERDELKEKLAAQGAARCASCGGEIVRGEWRVSDKKPAKGKDKPAEKDAPAEKDGKGKPPAVKKKERGGFAEFADDLLGDDDDQDDD